MSTPETDREAKAQERLERLRWGYRRWYQAMYGDGDLQDGPENPLTPEEMRRIAEALSIPESDPGKSC